MAGVRARVGKEHRCTGQTLPDGKYSPCPRNLFFLFCSFMAPKPCLPHPHPHPTCNLQRKPPRNGPDVTNTAPKPYPQEGQIQLMYRHPGHVRLLTLTSCTNQKVILLLFWYPLCFCLLSLMMNLFPLRPRSCDSVSALIPLRPVAPHISDLISLICTFLYPPPPPHVSNECFVPVRTVFFLVPSTLGTGFHNRGLRLKDWGKAGCDL